MIFSCTGVTGLSLPCSTSRASSWVRWITSQFPPSCGYSLAMVLKQCGQDATIVRGAASSRIAMFCWASMENTNSFPIRLAGSPVQVSAGPSTANVTPAVCRSVAIALVVLRARSSSAPAQPTQNR